MPTHSGRSVLNVQDVKFTVPIKKFGRTVDSKTILKGVSFSMFSGETLAIMGPSGAGKTTLLDLLTLEGAGGLRTGHVDLNGQVMTDAVFKKYCAYVPQYDNGWPFLTCRECLRQSADFHMTSSAAEKDARVDELIKTMGLEVCQNTKVGNEFLKGLSGGQRRRLSLACAFLKDPLCVFLDEVTSGLDAAAAAGITNFLQDLARSKDVIIACTIHQPSAKIFKGFDRLLLLSGGNVAYCGKISEVDGYFKGLGIELPVQENPADVLLETVNADFIDPATVNKIIDAWAHEPIRQKSTGSFQVQDPKKLKRTGLNMCSQIWVLLRRMLLLAVRDPTVHLSRLVVCLFSCIFFAIVYVKSRERTQDQVLNRVWLYIWHMGVPAQMCLAACLGQNMEFVAVRREIKSGMYAFTAYFVAQLLIQLPYMILLSAFCISVSGYGIGNWNADAYVPALLVHALFMFSFECVAQLYAVQFRHPLLSMFQVVNFWFSAFLFGGFLVPESDVPWPFRVFTYFSPIKYGTKALLNLEFKGTLWEGAVPNPASASGFSCPGNPVACFGYTGDQVLDTLGKSIAANVQSESELFADCMCIFAIAAAFKLFYYIVAIQKCYDGNEVKPNHAALPSTLPNMLSSQPTGEKNAEKSAEA